jgi:TetR/AcrR family fatty acid metabolism transcriptional regulator
METRQRLYDAALELIVKKGFGNVAISDITDKAGVSKGNFYYYFRSKDELLLEEFLKVDRYLDAAMEKISKQYGSPLEQLEAITKAGVRYINDQGVTVIKAVYSSEIDPSMKKPRMGDSDRSIIRIVGRLMREAQERGELRRDISAESITEYFLQSYRGIAYEWCLRDGQFDFVEAYERFFELIIEGLKAKRSIAGKVGRQEGP